MKQFYFFLLASSMLAGLAACTDDTVAPEDNWVYAPTPYQLQVPAHFPILEIPEDNPTTEKGVWLGRMLYYDPITHADSAKSCATCHIQEHSFTSDPTVIPHINLGWSKNFLWNGKLQNGLEDAMLFEVSEFFKTDLSRLERHPDYPRYFYEAFGERTITYELAAKALAQFERTMISANSKYDRVLYGDQTEFFTDAELNGWEIFFTEKGDCFHCHGGILFTDNDFHNNALDTEPDDGLMAITGNPLDKGRFKTPTLRNIALTGPYMHDGRYETLEEVIDFYSEGLKRSDTVDPLMKSVHLGGKHLTEQEKSDLLAFLLTLTDSTYITNKNLASPF
ncbi:MAG: cytochrome c peroxidase [Saprospiraceae bacterium]